MNSAEEKLLNILMVERDPMDVVILRKRMRDLFEDGEHYQLFHFRDGFDALDYLQNGMMEVLPDLIVLDENLLRLEASHVLKALSADPKLRTIPVIIIQKEPSALTSRSKYRLMTNPVLKQPARYEPLTPFVAVLENYFAKKA